MIALGLLACTPNPAPPAREAEVESKQAPTVPEAAAPAVIVAAPAVAPVPAGPPVAAPPAPPPDSPVAVPAGTPALVEPPVLALPATVAAADLGRVTPAWETVQEFDRAVALAPIAGGVLVRVGGVPHELGPDGALVEKAAADAKTPRALEEAGEIVGVWPDDAWRVVEFRGERAGGYLSLFKWRGNNRWVAQPIAGVTKLDFESYDSFAWSPRGGMLVASPGDGVTSFERVAGRHAAPGPIATDGKAHAVFETAGGALYVFVSVEDERRRQGLVILRGCKPDEAPGCERSGGASLPGMDKLGDYYFVGPSVGRGRHGISSVLTAEYHPMGEKMIRHHSMIHHDSGGWEIEAVPDDREVEQLLAAADGGLWMVLGGPEQMLMHRSDAGVWATIELPPRLVGAAQIQVALRDEARLWIAGNHGDHHAIYAAPAALARSPAG